MPMKMLLEYENDDDKEYSSLNVERQVRQG